MDTVLRAAITDVLKTLGIGDVDFIVEHPADTTHGDYATNVALKVHGFLKGGQKQSFLKRTLGTNLSDKNPREVAEVIAEKLQDSIEYVDKVDIAGPGFINFTLDRSFFVQEVERSITHPKTWGHNNAFDGQKVMVEYTDPNPFKEFHIGHVFTNTVGESIARLFMASGAEVRRANYQGDVGLHVAHAIWGMQQLGISAEDTFTARDLGRAYATGATAYKEDKGNAQEEIRAINKHVYMRDNHEINALYDAGRTISLDYFETIYALLGTKFDCYFFESAAAPKGKEVVLSHSDVFVESEGARVFKGEDYGLHTRVFLNKEGLPTYEAKELALAKMKYDIFPYDLSIVSTANEISEYFKVLKKAMSFVYPELEKKTEHIGHGTVRLTTGKMSSRTGDVIPAVEFVDEIKTAVVAKMKESGTEDISDATATQVAVGSIKYATLRSNILQDSVFDKERALSFEGDSGPYLQYTHARIQSVLEKAKDAGVAPAFQNVPETPYELERLLYRYPEVVEEATIGREPHKVTTYLTELAGAFNTFYAQEKIADSSDEYAPYKAALAKAVGVTLKNGLWVLGIEAPEKM